MVIKEPSTFHDSVKPIVYFNCFVGMGVHWQPDITTTKYFWMQLYTIIFILTSWWMVYFGWMEVINISGYYDDTSPAARTMYQVLVRTNCVIAVVSPFILWVQKKGLQDCLQKMPILDDTFQVILGAQNEYRKRYICLTCQVLGILSVMLLLGSCSIQWILLNKRSLLENIAITVTLHYPIIVVLVLDANFCNFVGYLREKFQDLNDSLLRLVEKPSASYPGKKIFVMPQKVSKATPDRQMKDMQAESSTNDKQRLLSHHLLYEIRKVQLELCKLSRKINLVFGLQNLLSIGISFVMVTGLLYTIYSAVVWRDLTTGKLDEVVPSIAWTLVYIFKIWIVNHSCQGFSNEAGRTGEVIYELFERRLDKELQKEIREFAVQMLLNPVRFNACGFFTLDYTFVQGVIGSITTYLVILIQMSPSTSIIAAAGNCSEISTN